MKKKALDLVEGKPVLYVRGASGQTFDAASNAGALYLKIGRASCRERV